VHLLDDRQEPVAQGAVGEIHIGGIGLATGYLNQPELTAEKFVADPCSAGPDARLYKTGDLARRLPDGNIEFVGRQDNQVKVRGFRIELEEIEDALKVHPSVTEVAVIPVINAQRQTRLVAYLQLHGRGQHQVAELRNYLRSKLPAQFVPDLFISLPALPRNEHNKIDRNALLQRPIATNYDQQGLHGPRDSTDLLLLEIWDELLGASVGIDDDFFEAGGTSLLAISLLARIEKRTGRSLPLSTLFSRTTVRALSEALIRDLAQDAQGEVLELHKGTGGKPLFFMHGDFMGGFFSKDIANAAELPGPFLVMQPYDSYKQQELPESIAAMASAHIRTMRKEQPDGPYRLAGYCNGALIAFEMAQQLAKEGEEVEFLGLIDPSHPFTYPPQVFSKESTERFLGRYAKSTDLSRVLVEDAEYRSRLLNHFSEVCASYEADHFRGDISLILIEQHKGERDPVRAWKKVARNLDVYQFQGERAFHGAAPRQHAGWLGQTLRQALDRLEENAPTSADMPSE
jgi:surfactin synthase thioesterase subunit